MKRHFHAFDIFWTKQIGRIPSGFQPLFVWLGRFTTPLIWVSVFTVTHVLWITPGNLGAAAVAAVVLLPLATIMKLFFRRHRPPTIYAAAMRVKSYSFPSSHAYSAALAGGFLILEAFHLGFFAVAMLMIALVGLIGISRVHVGAHYPSDVVAGWSLGCIMLGLIALLA